MSKPLTILTFASIIVQIIFSFYYSSNIVNQNNQLDEYKQNYQKLNMEIALTKKELADLTSIQHYQEGSPSASLSPISKSIIIPNY